MEPEGANSYSHADTLVVLSLIHISEPTRQAEISYAVFCLKKKKKNIAHIYQDSIPQYKSLINKTCHV